MSKFPKTTYPKTNYASYRVQNNPPKALPLMTWCRQNYYSRSQALRFLRTHDLLGVTYKGKMHVMVCPESIVLNTKS